jgi:hypothetical protein
MAVRSGSPALSAKPSRADTEMMLTHAQFTVLAEATPGLLPRLLQPLAKRDLTPDSLHARREGALMRVELTLEAMPEGEVHLVAGNLGQVVGVLGVETQRGAARRAA